MKTTTPLRYFIVALIAAACGAGGTYAFNHLQQQLEYAEVILPMPEPPPGEQPTADISLADLLQGMNTLKPYAWSYSGHHGISMLANGPYFPEDEADMCTEQEIRDATSAAIQIYLEDYHNLELAWWQSNSPLRRIIILSVFYSQMSPKICCFPQFACRSFAPDIAEQRRKEIEWVAAHRNEIHKVLSPLVKGLKEKREKHE
jgi:hypothetical protein